MRGAPSGPPLAIGCRQGREPAARRLWRTNSPTIAGRLCASSLFHVKQRSAWRPWSPCWIAGGARPISSPNSTFASVWTRHIADSAQLLALAPEAKRWVDMGSGAGFPGLVIAIQLADVPGAIVHCIESDRRKCAFLREAARATGAAAAIHPRARRSNRPRKPRSCGRRDRARLRPLAADARIGETVDGARGHWRVSARRIQLRTKSRRCLRRRLMRSKRFRASSTRRPRSCAFAKAETQPHDRDRPRPSFASPTAGRVRAFSPWRTRRAASARQPPPSTSAPRWPRSASGC